MVENKDYIIIIISWIRGGQNFGTTVDTQLHALIDESKLAKYFKLFWYFLFNCFVV